MRIAVSAAILIVASSVLPAAAHACSDYERQVYKTAQAVEEFRETRQFRDEYGWSAAGPYNQWLNRIRELNDDKEKALDLLGSHGFVPMEIYSVADEFRTAGGLDSFYRGLDKDIKSLRCR